MSERPFARRVVSEKALTTRASGLRFTRRAVVRERSRQVMAGATDDRHGGGIEACTPNVEAQDATFASP
jgi:hypothetical protein